MENKITLSKKLTEQNISAHLKEKIERMKSFEKELAELFNEKEDDIENDPVLKLLIEKGALK